MQPSTRAAIVGALQSHDPAANLGDLSELVPLIFDELRVMARRQLSRQHERYTLQTTELVHEAYLRLIGDNGVTRRGRAYFYAAASRAMRQVLVDAARRRNAVKRGSGVVALSLDEGTGEVDAYAHELLDLDVALQELERRNPRFARVVECRFFGGMSVEDTAEALGVSPRTVKSDWAMARAWLYDALRGTAA
jgi:RNA polymerase sigma factor (TIGR02999 family)